MCIWACAFRLFPPNLAPRLALTQPNEDRLTEEAAQIGDLGDELWPHPVDLGRRQRAAEAGLARRSNGERHLRDRQGL